MSMNATRKVFYTLHRPSVNVRFYPPVTNGGIPSMHEAIAHALVKGAFRAAIRRKGDSDTAKLWFAYLSPDNIEDNAHVAYLAYTQALRTPTYDEKAPLIPISPRRCAYRALSRHIYASKARRVKYNPDVSYSIVMQGTSFDVVARDNGDYHKMAGELMGAPSVVRYLAKHPDVRRLIVDIINAVPAHELRKVYGCGSSKITAIRNLLRTAWGEVF